MAILLRFMLGVGSLALLVLGGVIALWRPDDAGVEWIVYTADVRSASSIYRMRPDGTGVRLIAQFDNQARNLSWSPDGSWLAFEVQELGYRHIYRMRGDGSHLQRLTDSNQRNWVPTWSPNGQWIAFYANDEDRQITLYRMRADGSDERWLADVEPASYGLDWSKDGRWIIFETSELLDSTRNVYRPHDIYKVQMDGAFRTRLTYTDGSDRRPQLSPDGEWIVWLSMEADNRQLLRMRMDGSDGQSLFQAVGLESSGQWSPDGEQIVFTYRDGPRNVHIVGADGGQFRQVTHLRDVAFARWSPDGAWISFIAFEDTSPNYNVYRVRPDGGDLQKLTDAQYGVEDYAWSPTIDMEWVAWQTIAVGVVMIVMALGLFWTAHWSRRLT